MQRPVPANPADEALRQFAGNCYLALQTRDRHYLTNTPEADTLRRSGLAGMYVNLCERLGVALDKSMVIHGMQLSLANENRWQGLVRLLASLHVDGIEPVLFKGGVLHARWPDMRGLRALSDYDLIVPGAQLDALQARLAQDGYDRLPDASWLTRRLIKGSMVWKGDGLDHHNMDIHAHVTEPPVCASLTRSILATELRAEGVRIPDLEDCVCMIALHIVRSGMHRPLREYIDLLWYVDGMDEAQWRVVVERAGRHDLLPALFLSLRQAVYCLALETLDPARAEALKARIAELRRTLGPLRLRMLDWLAAPDYPLHPVESRNRPVFRRSVILSAGTSCLWRVGVAFLSYGAVRVLDHLSGRERIAGGRTGNGATG